MKNIKMLETVDELKSTLNSGLACFIEEQDGVSDKLMSAIYTCNEELIASHFGQLYAANLDNFRASGDLPANGLVAFDVLKKEPVILHPEVFLGLVFDIGSILPYQDEPENAKEFFIEDIHKLVDADGKPARYLQVVDHPTHNLRFMLGEGADERLAQVDVHGKCLFTSKQKVFPASTRKPLTLLDGFLFLTSTQMPVFVGINKINLIDKSRTDYKLVPCVVYMDSEEVKHVTLLKHLS